MLVERYVRKLLAKKAEGNTSIDVVSDVAEEGFVATAACFRHCRHFFRGGSFVDFGGEKEGRKEGGKFQFV